MTSVRVTGAIFVLGALACVAAAFVGPGTPVLFIGLAVVFGLCGALFLWMHTFMKDVPRVGMRSGLSRMAEGTAQAAATLREMTGRLPGDLGRDIDRKPGTARIDAVRDTGLLVNFDPVVLLDLTVTVEGGPPYPVHRREVVSKVRVGRLTSGTSLPVLVDPQDPYELVIDWR